jgi:acetyl-CoA acyltransferase
MGCTMTVGEQAMNIGRNAALAAGFPDTVPGTTVDRQCGSAQQAVHFAAQAVMSGAMDIAIGAGVESMSRVPIGSTTDPGPGEAYGPTVHALRVHPPGPLAEEIARRWEISREEMDAFALESHRRAARARTRAASPTRSSPGPGSGPPTTARPTSRRRGPLTSTRGSAGAPRLEKLAALAPPSPRRARSRRPRRRRSPTGRPPC